MCGYIFYIKIDNHINYYNIFMDENITPLTGPNAIQIIKDKMGIKKKNTKNKKHKSPKNTDLVVGEKEKAKEQINNIYEEDVIITILTKFMKEQNRQLLNKIAQYKDLSECETQELINKYLKPHYYTPELRYV